MVEQAKFVREDGTTYEDIPQQHLPPMGFGPKDIKQMKAAASDEKFANSLRPNLVGTDIHSLLLKVDDPDLAATSSVLQQSLYQLQSDINAHGVEVKAAIAKPLRLEMKSVYKECRRLLDLKQTLLGPLGTAQNNHRSASQEWNSDFAKLQRVRQNPPPASSWPTDSEIEEHEGKCENALGVLQQTENRMNSWQERVNELEAELRQVEQLFSNASTAYVNLQKKVSLLTGEPLLTHKESKKSSVNPSNSGLQG